MLRACLLLISLALFFSCARQKLNKDVSDDLDNLQEMMTGKFTSGAQAAQDSQFYDISLTMIPIWPDDQSAKWLYVEQAVTATITKPYRQRVYRLSKVNDITFESRVYELPSPDKYIHGWENESVFSLITPDDLMIREGCSVFLEKQGDCFAGATKEGACKSTLRGASYATSSVEICDGQIVSWDQGWSAEKEQVWGAVEGGYVFARLEN